MHAIKEIYSMIAMGSHALEMFFFYNSLNFSAIHLIMIHNRYEAILFIYNIWNCIPIIFCKLIDSVFLLEQDKYFEYLIKFLLLMIHFHVNRLCIFLL